MALPEIRFEDIRPFEGSRNTGFEELCCQLASLEPRPSGTLFYRKGRGGDAGVECYLSHAGGAETGWQAKYIFSWSPTLEAELDGSIRTALTKHPNLTEYIVCIPFDPSDARAGKGRSALKKWQDWQAKWLAVALSEARTIAIPLWSKSIISERLARNSPAYGGRLAYWFDQELLSPAWFEHQFAKARAALGSRYTPETNVELPIRRDFLAFARDPELNQQIDRWSLSLQEDGRAAVEAVTRAIASGKDDHSADLSKLVDELARAFACSPVAPEASFPVDRWKALVRAARDRSRDTFIWARGLPEAKPAHGGSSPAEWAQHLLLKLSDLLEAIEEDLDSRRWQLANVRQVLLYGSAGVGKSHLLADVVEEQIASGKPALLVLGSTLVEAEPWRQILGAFDLPPGQQIKQFLGALDAAAEAAGTRTIICVDALNERHGMDIWPERLAAFLKEVERFPRLGIVVSCRTTYLDYIVPAALPETVLPRVEHHGFSGHAAEAARVYLDKRGIKRPGAPNMAEEFENPLFLKTCCDYLEKDGRTELPKGLRGVTSLFGFYNDAITRALNARMKLDERQQVVPRAIAALAGAYAARGIGYLETSVVLSVFEAILPSGGKRDQSLLTQLESEGLLIVEAVVLDDGTRGEEVRFTFERMSDHAIAKRLLDEHLDPANPLAAFAPDTKLREFVCGKDAHTRAGVIEAIAVQLPERVQIELPDAVSATKGAWVVDRAFLESLLWREQQFFTQRTFDLVKGLQQPDEVRELLVEIATEPANIFNAKYLHERLFKLSMPERDQRWSTFVSTHGDAGEGAIETLVSWAFEYGFEEIDADRAELAGIALTWLFGTSNRRVRDRATKSLACLLAPRLTVAADLLKRFREVDDPYILERLMGAIYGAALQGIDGAGLPTLADAVDRLLFEGDQPPVNLLTRDHACGLIRYADWRGALTDRAMLQRAAPPYRSSWPIEHVPDALIETYVEDRGRGAYSDAIVSSAVNDGDFARYVIDRVVDDWSPAPIGTPPPTAREVYEVWLADFRKAATGPQLAAFNDLLRAAKALGGSPRHEQTPERVALAKAEQSFRDATSPDAWEGYRVRGRDHVTYSLFSKDQGHREWPAKFNTQWARRWICKRAHDLGWTSERFGHFEEYGSSSYSRHDHRHERIGKKYQWIALFELAARMADNLAFLGDSFSDEGAVYETARQPRLRDIDPSLLVARTHYDGWKQWPRTWWVPFAPILRPLTPAERLGWRDTDQDLVNDSSLIDVVNPRDGRRWLVLDGYSGWRQNAVVGSSKVMERETWFRLRCLVVRKKDETKIVAALKGRSLVNPDALPKIELHGEHYLGEYPWHPSLAHLNEWVKPSHYRGLAVPTRTTVADYTCESGNNDYSIDQTISVTMPSPWLMEALGLRLANGKKLTFLNRNEEALFFDPSVSERGPQAALVDRDAFLAMLDREDMAAVWVIAGEKGVFGGREPGSGWGGRLVHTNIYQYRKGAFVRHEHRAHEQPSKMQLKEFLSSAS